MKLNSIQNKDREEAVFSLTLAVIKARTVNGKIEQGGLQNIFWNIFYIINNLLYIWFLENICWDLYFESNKDAKLPDDIIQMIMPLIDDKAGLIGWPRSA